MMRIWLSALATLAACVPAWAGPVRIMSLNLCADQLVLALASPEHIASVTYLARDCDQSVECAAAAHVPINYGTAEEMIAAAPDLVISGLYTTRATVAIARHFGFVVHDMDVPHTLGDVRTQIREVAALVGEPARGEAMVAALDRKLVAIPPPGPSRPVAAVYETNGFTVGRSSLINDALKRAGFDNLAVRLGIDNYPSLPLEMLVAGQPDLLVLNTRNDKRPSLGAMMLVHPILASAFSPERQIVVPQKLWVCGTPAVADAIRLLVNARQRIGERVP